MNRLPRPNLGVDRLASEPARSVRPEFEIESELSQPDSSLEGVRVCICVGA